MFYIININLYIIKKCWFQDQSSKKKKKKRQIFTLFLFPPILNLDNHRKKIQDIYLNLLYLEHSASFM